MDKITQGFLLLMSCVALMSAGFILSYSWLSKNWSKFFKSPELRFSTVTNQKGMEKIFSILPSLSVAEKELVIQQIFTRPILIAKGLDRDGRTWLEAVSPLVVDDTNFNFHFNDTNRKPGRHIG